jgi:hypothetical protein
LLGLLLDFYLTTLRNHGMDISNSNTLSSLFYSDDEHADEIKTRVEQLPAKDVPENDMSTDPTDTKSEDDSSSTTDPEEDKQEVPESADETPVTT